MELVRIQIDLAKDKADELDVLMKETGVQTKGAGDASGTPKASTSGMSAYCRRLGQLPVTQTLSAH